MVNGIPPGGSGKIGGPKGPLPAAGPDAREKTGGAERPSFGEALGKTEKTQATQAPTPLERLRAGEIDVQRYAELRVQEATQHLEGILPPQDLEKIRADLHDLIENDPDVAALVKTAQIGR